MKVKIKKIDVRAKIPTKHDLFDAAFDLYSIEEININSQETKVVRTGICMEIPPGYYGKISTRSSIASKGVYTTGGIIDSGYRGEIMIILNNIGIEYTIKEGDRIAQIIFHKVETVEFEEVTNLNLSNDRGGGFGSSNK